MKDVQYIQATERDIQMLIDYRILFATEVSGSMDSGTELNLRNNLREYFLGELNKSYYSWYAVLKQDVITIGGMTIRSQPGNAINPSGIWAYIVGIYTVPAYRRKGLSDNIIKKLLKTGTDLKITSFELHATKAGEGVYIKNGFQIHNQPTYRKYL